MSSKNARMVQSNVSVYTPADSFLGVVLGLNDNKSSHKYLFD